MEQYQVRIICAPRHEMTVAIAILDEQHQAGTGQDKLDRNNYVLGWVHEHNVVIACLPGRRLWHECGGKSGQKTC
jgi:hypothetical protein